MGVERDDPTGRFLSETVGEYTGVELLDGDASTRRYYRVRTASASYMLCRDSSFINVPETEFPFTIMHRLLEMAVPVPAIYAMDNRLGLFLLQDLGDDLLEYVVPLQDDDSVERLYRSCLENLFAIQNIRGKGGVPFSLSFDVSKLMYEFDFFIEHALRGYFRAPAGADMGGIRKEFQRIADILCRPELFVLNHRDYHSRNIILCGGVPFIIDFQDARMGLPQYDVVSLLRDSYVTLAPALFERLKRFYFEGSRDGGIHAMGRDEFDYYFDVMAFQRNVKALGTFGYQVTARGNPRYEEYIAPTSAYLAAYAERQEALRPAWRILGNHLGARR
jgi:N-acetylmuramate 1-kinase